MTNEVTVSDEESIEDELPAGVELLECDDKTYFVAGPSTSFIVQGKQHVRPMVIAACMINGDDEASYKPREVTAVTCTPTMPSIHLMVRNQNTTLH